jgi:hypothetical protein
VARNAWFGVALLALTTVAACGGEVVEVKAAQAAQAQLAKVRARTDRIRQLQEAKMASVADTTARSESAGAQMSLAATAPAESATASVTPSTAKPAGMSSVADSLDQDAEAALADSVQRAREIDVLRETFAYAGGTRDPFNSLINQGKNGPEISDLDLVGVYLDLRTPSNNVVVLREKRADGKRHKMRVGDQLGRSRLTQIRARDAVFTIQDFGFDRQETLSLRKQEVETP